MPARSDFEGRSDCYDALIDWQKRLANEGPFYRRLFAEHQVRSVLDAACGTGRHAEMFHGWGLRVEGADLSSEMIALCRRRLGESDTLRWVERSFTEPAELPASFDAAVCVGNSLALADDPAGTARALTAMAASVRPGGVVVVHVLNLWRLAEGETVWQKCRRLTLDGQDRVLLKSIHRTGVRGFVDLVDLTLIEGGVRPEFHATTFRGIEPDELTRMAQSAGLTGIELYGNYQREPYQREESEDLILVGRR